MWKFLGKLLEFWISGFKLEVQKLADSNASLLNRMTSLEETLMNSKETLQALATQMGELIGTLPAKLNNIAADIQGLNEKLVNAVTPEEVQAILQPQIDALQAVADAAQQTADIVPDPVVEPPPGGGEEL